MEIAVIDDHKLFRIGLKEILQRSREHRVVSEYGTGSEYLERGQENPADLVLIDIHLESENGLTIIKAVKSQAPNQKIAVLSMDKDERPVRESIAYGVKGYFYKNIDSEELLFGLRKIAAGGKYFSTHITELLLQKINPANPIGIHALTEREKQLLPFLIEGYSSHEIANFMKLSKRTIDAHRANILAKLHFKNTPQLVRYLVENNFHG